MLPKALARDLELAWSAVQANPARILNPGYRWVIWAHMGEVGEKTAPCYHVGHRRRTVLAIASARRVLPLWNQRWPRNPQPGIALAAAIDYLDARRSLCDCRRISDRTRDAVDAVIAEDFSLSYAGESAIKALSTALDDEYFKPGVREFDWVDGQMDGDDNDAASTAAIALSRGTGLNARSDPAVRSAFWDWWLHEAVPRAYRDGTSLPARGRSEPDHG